jgi:hypothetical protein
MTKISWIVQGTMVFALGFAMSSFAASVHIALGLGMCMSFVYTFASLNRIDFLLVTLNAKRKDVVSAQYIFSILATIFGGLAALSLAFLGSKTAELFKIHSENSTSNPPDFDLKYLPVLIILIFLMIANELFFAFFKSEKGKFWHVTSLCALVILIAVFGFFMSIFNTSEIQVFFGNLILKLSENVWYIYTLLGVIALVALFISYKFSVLVYKKREF